ncbi:hypothetical protein EYC80_006776 [Monilinia laxa]|uniref:Uncharacterized protein n=1 Tax=Monilinia laxa TaxID=61186 RepID=A0A5N6JZ47_MONLA|nr:hypothetical protein EYC80_006776 [Monilinia laxa]
MPRTRSRHATRISRRSPPRDSPDGTGSRPRLKVKDICVGCIVWLPPKVESDESIKCVRDGSCCDGIELDSAGYNHPVIILQVQGASCSVAKITSQPPKFKNLAKRIPISQNLPPHDFPNSNSALELYVETSMMEKTILYSPRTHLFNPPLNAPLAERFGISIDTGEWVETYEVALRSVNNGRRQKVTFKDPWEDIRSDTSDPCTKRKPENLKRSIDQRHHAEPTSSTTLPALPPPRLPQTRTVSTSTRDWYTYNLATDRSILRELAVERTPLLQNPSPVPLPSSSPRYLAPVQPNRHQQYYTLTSSRSQRSNYQAALPSVERYDRSHWDARIRNTNTRTHDLESGGNSGEDGEGDCDGRLFVQLVVIFLSVGGLFWWLYGV